MPLRKSPVASATMIRSTCYGVEIDICPVSGGVWLDKGELKQIISRTRNQDYLDEFNRLHSYPQTVNGNFENQAVLGFQSVNSKIAA